MPAELPPTSAYTYCAEFSADEALAAGARSIQFNQPVIAYLENFLNFPVGIGVPVGYYDRVKGVWVPSPDGRVIKIISIAGGLADLDTDGDGTVDNGVALGVTMAERQKLGGLYTAGQTLWRVSIAHFTTYDCNYGIVPPANTTIGPLPAVAPGNANTKEKPCTSENYGCIEFQNQIFGEAVNVTGTPYRLHYSSDRVPGYIAAKSLRIPLSGNTISPFLNRIHLELFFAGRKYTQSFPAAANQEYTFFWDSRDAYGRLLQGQQGVTIRIGYVYNMYYALPPGMAASFGFPSGVKVPGDIPAREEMTLWLEQQGLINLWGAKALGLGGWSLTPHHVYDPQGKVLHYGDGKRRSVENMNSVITTVAGTGTCGYSGDGGPATQAQLYSGGIAVGPDGSLYIGGNAYIRRVTPDGVINTFAGNGFLCLPSNPCGDGGPATQANVSPFFMDIGPDGSLYFSDQMVNRIRKVDRNGIITRVAGNGSRDYGGDGGPALQAGLYPSGIKAAADGSLFISDSSKVDILMRPSVRRVGPDGIISTYAGNGTQDYGGDGGPALQAGIFANGLDMGPDGSLYIANDMYNGVRRVTPDGIINRVAGRDDFSASYSGDGGPATQAGMKPSDVAMNRDGSFYIADWANNRVRRIGPDGIITTIAGGDTPYHGYPDGEPATQAYLSMPYSIATAPDGSIYISGLNNCRVRRVASAFPGFNVTDIGIASEDGSLLYQFDPTGRHLKTINTLTGATVFTFNYDSGHLLATITDGDGNVTTIERDGNGNPTGILGPYGQRTALTLNANGYLASVTNPAGETTQLGYGNEGLLTSVTGPRGSRFYLFDDL